VCYYLGGSTLFENMLRDVLEGGEIITLSSPPPSHHLRERSETQSVVIWTAVARRGSRRGGSQSLRETAAPAR